MSLISNLNRASPKWKLRRSVVAAVIILVAVAIYTERGWWLWRLGRSLVCEEGPTAKTVILDNFDNEYGLFKWGADFQRAGARVIVPVTTAEDHDAIVSAQQVATTFARLAGLSQWEMIPIIEKEPVSLNTALRVREFLTANGITSVTLVSNGFRSRRSALVYRSVLNGQGISLTCRPTFGTVTPDNWTATSHGIQDVLLQFLKLQYYRFWVLPVRH